MKRALLFALIAAAVVSATAQSPATPPPELRQLDRSVGRWIFHGTIAKTATRPAAQFTWNEDCRWSPNHLFLNCTFSNVWNGRTAESLVVDTYNTTDHAFWHYEMFSTGGGGAHPFAARMDVQGDTWIEYGAPAVPGKSRGERIIYRWHAPDRVSVAIETSGDGTHWTTVDTGEGVKRP